MVRIKKITIFLVLGILTQSTKSSLLHNQENWTKIHQFRALLEHTPYIRNTSQVFNFVKDDLYVARWLEAGNSNVTLAHIKFMEHLTWRQLEKIDTIHLENWSYFQEQFPQFVDTTDRFGRPVAELWLSDWDFRRAFATGLTIQLKRWIAYLLEMSQRRLYETRRVSGHENITGVVELIDIAGFNRFQHACGVCIPLLMKFNHISKDHYPNIWARNYIVNAGSVYRSILSLSSSHAKYGSEQVLRFYTDRREWLPVVEREISRDQRSTKFGGTIVRY